MTIAKNLERIVLGTPWIATSRTRIDRLEALLREADASSGSDGQELVTRLVSRFVFLTSAEYDDFIMQVAEYIASEFVLEKTLLCATTADRNKDSAQRVLYDITSMLATIGVYKVRALNRFDVAIKEKEVDAVVLLDEFIGSGRSIVGRAQTLRQRYHQKGERSPPIHAIALAGMSGSLRLISHNFASLNVCLALCKGIEQYARGPQRQKEYQIMDNLESNLAPIFLGEAMPSLGYARSESLYSRQAGSCPNNVFPIFWWPELVGSRPRQPLCPRVL